MNPKNVMFLLALLCLCGEKTSAQVTDTSFYNYGIWQHISDPISKNLAPEIRGRSCNFDWKTIEPAPGMWDWVDFDSQLVNRALDTLPILVFVYTKEDAPEWLYTNGVPRVSEKNTAGEETGHAPYYADSAYKFYFKRMITQVRQHIDSMAPNVRKQIVAVQACFGSTGDYIGYKGTVEPQYALTEPQLFSLFKEFSLHYYNEYQNTNPKIYVLHNPPNNVRGHFEWIKDSCTISWIKLGSIGKGYQLNDEKSKSVWLLPEINAKQKGHIIRSRCEAVNNGFFTGWWDEFPHRNMFSIMTYGIHWGLDWSNQSDDQLADPAFDSAFFFFNKYAGQKDTANATNAMCALKDVIDAADSIRFPVAAYGPVQKTAARYANVLAPFIIYGARLEDTATALQTENENTEATGINDVGWDLFPGNYERYLRQINANATSAGYWNVSPGDTSTMYGRFARGFDLARGKNALYFDVDNGFLNNAPLNGKYSVIIEVTYYDSARGTWQLYYDAKNDSNKLLLTVQCTDSRKWKKASITVKDAYFGNRSPQGADFYIISAPGNTKRVLFSVVELARPNSDFSNTGLFATPLAAFDTSCVNSVSLPKAITLSGAFLTSQSVEIGPKTGFSFSESADGVFSDSLVLNGINAYFKKDIYIRFNPKSTGSFSGAIPVKGGGIPFLTGSGIKQLKGILSGFNPVKGGSLAVLQIPVKAFAVNSSPQVNANVTTISCKSAKDGSIDITLTDGTGPFTFNWVNDTTTQKFTTEDISGLFPATYTLTVGSYAGCSVSSSYLMTQPEVVVVSLAYDPMICRNGTTNLYVTATGGTLPYTGTGTFVVGPDYQIRTVTDARGCSDFESIQVVNGTLVPPAKPAKPTGPFADSTGVCPVGTYSYSVALVANATYYKWGPPAGSGILSANPDSSQIVLQTNAAYTVNSSLTVSAANVCGISDAQTLILADKPKPAGTITGPTIVNKQQAGIIYSVVGVAGLTYTWGVPAGAVITAGQNTPVITVTMGNNSGNITVKANNACASSAGTQLAVSAVNAFVQSENNTPDNAASLPVANGLLLYPNPARDMAYIKFDAVNTGNYRIRVTDITGKALTDKSGIMVKGTNYTAIDVHILQTGMYIVTLYKNKEQAQTVKLVIE